jgi:tetratricopeptide (TPR) repeat protein
MNIGTLVIMALGAVTLCTGGPAVAQTVAERVKEATRLEFDEGKRDAAAAIYRELLKTDAGNFDALIGMGRILTLDGDYAAGRQHLEKAIAAASDTQRSPALSSLAIAWVFAGNGAEAAKRYEQVYASQLKAGAFSPAANTANALGRALLETGNADAAEKWYRTGYETAAKIRDVPAEEKDLWEMRWQHAQGRIAARRKQFDAARKHLAAVEALVAKGTLPEQQRQFLPQLAGYIAFYQGNYDQAIAELGKADQDDPFVLWLQAQAFEQKKDAARADESYKRLLAQPGYSLQMALTRPLAQKKLAGR